MDVNMTLAHIRAMLWIYYSGEDLPDDGNGDRTAHLVRDLCKLGLVLNSETAGRPIASPKGIAYAEALRAVPLPTQRWIVEYPQPPQVKD